MPKEFNEITKEDFEAYEEVRKEGCWNMFDLNARRATGLDRETYIAVMEYYSELMEKFPGVRQ